MTAYPAYQPVPAPPTFAQPDDFYRVRDFGQKWEATAQLLREHGRPLLHAQLRYAAPWLLLAAVIQTAGVASGAEAGGYERLGGILERVADIVGAGMTYAFFRLRMNQYQAPGTPLTVADVWRETRHTGTYFGKLLVSGFLLLASFLLLIVPGIYVAVTLALLPGVVFMENEGIGRAFGLIKGHWWSTAALAGIVFLLTVGMVLVPAMLVGIATHGEMAGNWALALGLHGFAAAASLAIQLVREVLLGFNYFSVVEAQESRGLAWRASRLGTAPTPAAAPDHLYAPSDEVGL